MTDLYAVAIKNELVGRLAIIHPLASEIEKIRKDKWGVGYAENYLDNLRGLMLHRDNFKLIFIDQTPDKVGNISLFCVGLLGDGYTVDNTDWLWLSLGQLIICQD